MKALYVQRISKVLDFIDENLDQKLSLNQLADIAMFSKYHFHRIFKAIIGENLNEFIKRTRMEKAYRFLQTDKTNEIKDLAYKLGYQSTANFTRDFKLYYNETPGTIKLAHKVSGKAQQKLSSEAPNVKYLGIKELTNKFVVYKKIITGYNTGIISLAFTELYQLALQHKFSIEQFIGIGYDDPDYTPKDKCKYDACMQVDATTLPQTINYNSKTIEGGKYAVFYFEGHEKNIARAWDYMFKEWLVNSEYEPDNKPHIEMYEHSEKYEQGIFKVNLCLPIKQINSLK